MAEFRDLKIELPQEDHNGKRMLKGQYTKLCDLNGEHITITDFELDVQVERYKGTRTVVSFQYDDGRAGKYFTSDRVQTAYLVHFRDHNLLPLGVTIGREPFGNGNFRYFFK